MTEPFNLVKLFQDDYIAITTDGDEVFGFTPKGVNFSLDPDSEWEGYINGIKHEFKGDGTCVTNPNINLVIKPSDEVSEGLV